MSCPGHHFAAFAAASYVRETNTDQWGIIDRVTYDDHVLKVSGRMLDGILDGVTLSRDVQDERVNNLTRMEVYYQIIFNPTTQGVPRVDGRAGDRLSELREQIAADTGTSTPAIRPDRDMDGRPQAVCGLAHADRPLGGSDRRASGAAVDVRRAADRGGIQARLRGGHCRHDHRDDRDLGQDEQTQEPDRPDAYTQRGH